MNAYEQAIFQLFQVGFADFVAERKRLSAQLKGAGDKEGAAKLAKLPRPPVSAWAVNQLWWRERASFDELLAAAARLRTGDREASQAHRQALATLREAAARILQDSGNAASDATLRRVATTLSAVAAAGGFEPEPAGALTQDRDPPGFEVMGALGAASTKASAPAAVTPPDLDAERRRRAEEVERQRAEDAERQRAEDAERRRRVAERERLSLLLRNAEQLRDAQQREVDTRRAALETAEQALKQTRALLAEIQTELANL